jgi:hypothetical protein
VNDIGQPEHTTQNLVIALFHDEPGYRYFSDMHTEIATLETKIAKPR